MKSFAVSQMPVHHIDGAARGVLQLGERHVPCAIGKAGVRALKREGDGASPLGSWSIDEVFYRADRIVRPRSRLVIQPMQPNDAWCDVVGDRNYNRRVRLPYPTLDERLWRDDHLYDVCVILGHNRRPRVQGAGSAIFLHLAREGYAPTAGCIALNLRDMFLLLAVAAPGDRLSIG